MKSRKKKIWKNKFKGFSQIDTISKIELVVIFLSISAICRDAWFIDFGAHNI
jgi:hypothetical protein